MPRPRNAVQDPMFLAAALEGLELRKQQIEEQIRSVRSMMGQRSPVTVAAPRTVSTETPKTGRKRMLSPAARKRIALAQKKRWAEFRKAKSGEATE
ncbi:MAG: hypothetical protein SFV51_07915 [Bryobacteraceae bacterium]|nr:hypothetical protein [Bryobacteraceae bacterium]